MHVQVNCDALATENITLRSQLKAYKQQLEEAKLQPKHTTTTATQTLEESTKSDTEELVTKLQARVKKLEKQREEVRVCDIRVYKELFFCFFVDLQIQVLFARPNFNA